MKSGPPTSSPTSTDPGTSNGPTEALNGRLEHLRGRALGFRNLTHNIARSLLETGGFRSDRAYSDPTYTLDCDERGNPDEPATADSSRVGTLNT